MEVIGSDDERLIKYLLNEQSAEENEELEDRMVLEPELANLAEVVEMKLIDSYVLDQMNPAEKARFEKGFLLFPENHDKVADARAFHANLRAQRQESVRIQVPADRELPAGWFVSVSRIQISALVVAAVVLMAVVVAYIFFFPDRDQKSVANSNSPGTTPNKVSQPPNSNSNSSNQVKTVDTPTPSPNKPAGDVGQIAKVDPPPNYNPIVSMEELGGREGESNTRGANRSGQIISPHLIEIPAFSKSFTLIVSLMPNEYFKQSLDCSVDISDGKFRRLFPKKGFLPIKVRPVAGEFPYQVDIEMPTALLKEGKLYYFRIDQTDSLTPFRVKFTK